MNLELLDQAIAWAEANPDLFDPSEEVWNGPEGRVYGLEGYIACVLLGNEPYFDFLGFIGCGPGESGACEIAQVALDISDIDSWLLFEAPIEEAKVMRDLFEGCGNLMILHSLKCRCSDCCPQ